MALYKENTKKTSGNAMTMQKKSVNIAQIIYDPDKGINPEYVCTGYMSDDDDNNAMHSGMS